MKFRTMKYLLFPTSLRFPALVAAGLVAATASASIDLQPARITVSGKDSIQLQGLRITGSSQAVDAQLVWHPQRLVFALRGTLPDASGGVSIDLSQAQFLAENAHTLHGVGIAVTGVPGSSSARLSWNAAQMAFTPLTVTAEPAEDCRVTDTYQRKYSTEITRITVQRTPAAALKVRFEALESGPFAAPEYLSFIQNNRAFDFNNGGQFKTSDNWTGGSLFSDTPKEGLATLAQGFDYAAPFIIRYVGIAEDVFALCRAS